MKPRLTLNDKTPLEIGTEITLNLNGERPESLSEYTSVTRLNPSVLIERSLLTIDQSMLAAVMQTLNSIYTAHYMQALALSMDIGGINAVEILQPFSTDPMSNPRLKLSIGGESYAESWGSDSLRLPDFSGESAGKIELDTAITKPSNLAVGKLIHVPVSGPAGTTTIPVNVTMSPREADIDFIVDLMTNLSKDRDLQARWHQVWAGEIRFFQDFIFNLDVLEAERKLAIRDEDGFYRESEMRRAAGLISTALTRKKQLNVASNLLCISTSGASRLDLAIRGKLSDYRARKHLFRETGSIIICVIDPMRERVKIYTRGVNEAAFYTFDDIQQNSSNPNGIDINAVMKAYNMAGRG